MFQNFTQLDATAEKPRVNKQQSIKRMLRNVLNLCKPLINLELSQSVAYTGRSTPSSRAPSKVVRVFHCSVHIRVHIPHIINEVHHQKKIIHHAIEHDHHHDDHHGFDDFGGGDFGGGDFGGYEHHGYP